MTQSPLISYGIITPQYMIIMQYDYDITQAYMFVM